MNPELESFGSISRAVGAVAVLLAAASGIGDLLVRLIANVVRRAVELELLRITVGLNLLALTAVVLGFTRLLAGTHSLWLLGALSLLNLSRVWSYCRGQRSGSTTKLRRDWFGGEGRERGRTKHAALQVACSRAGASLRSAPSYPLAARLIGSRKRLPWGGVGALTLAVLTLGPALCYPTGWDELAYHEVLPRRWLADGSLTFYSDLPYSAFPSLSEILFWLMAPIESVIAPRLLVWICWILGLGFLYLLLRRRLASGSSAIVTLVVAISDTMLMISANCYVETLLMMNVAATLLAVELRTQQNAAGDRWTTPAILAVLAGGAAAVKLTGLAAAALPILWYAGQAWRNHSRWRAAAWSCAVYSIVTPCVFVPFYLRSWLATGNPFYPYLAEWFTTDPVRLDLSRYHHAIGGFAFGARR